MNETAEDRAGLRNLRRPLREAASGRGRRLALCLFAVYVAGNESARLPGALRA